MYDCYSTTQFMYTPFAIHEPNPPNYGRNSANQPYTARQHLAQKLRTLRCERRWSQERLALEAGLERSYVGAIERAERNLSLDNIEKLANAFDLSIERLFELFGRKDKG